MKHKHIKAYIKCAEAFAECSTATRLKVGSVLVKNNRIISCGYNALPEYIEGPCEDGKGNTRPEVRHSERNCLKGLEKCNESSIGSVMFCTHSPCLQCSIDLVDAGILKFYYKTHYRDLSGLDYLVKNGIEVIQVL